MSHREKFLRAVDNDDHTQFIELTTSSSSKKSSGQRSGSSSSSMSSSMSELLSELSRKQVEEVWSVLQMQTTAVLLNFQDTTEAAELKRTGAFLQGVVNVAMASIQLTEIPSQLLQTALILHGVLLSLPPELESVQLSIARLCEAWYSAKLDGAQDLSSQTFMYLLEKSLAPEAKVADVKRVWQMCGCLERIKLEEESSSTLCNLLLHTVVAPAYLKAKTEGKKFFTFMFGLNLNFIDQLHDTIKAHIPTSSSAVLVLYGEVYFEAWKAATGLFLMKVEQSCIQDLMYRAVHAQRAGSRPLAAQIAKVLAVIHQQKLHRGVDEMLLTLYEPIIWRSLKVANADVRANAAALLFDVFPLQNPQASNEDNDTLLQKQFDVFDTLLCDPSAPVRVLAVTGMCSVCRLFWEMIPAQVVRGLLQRLLLDLAWDSASPDVRAAVIKGVSSLLDNPLVHPLLKNILPELRNLLHDTAEKVRVAFVEMLLKVKGMRAIKFWSIVPMEHLLARLELEAGPVARRIVRLVLNSYLPVDGGPDVQLQRCIVMLQTNRAAARKFYQYAPKHLTLPATVKLISALSACVHSCVKDHADVINSSLHCEGEEEEEGEEKSAVGGGRRRRNRDPVPRDILDSSEEEEEEEEDKENAKDNDQEKSGKDNASADALEEANNISCEDTELMAGLIDTMLILWMSVAADLNKESNKELKRKLQYRMSHLLPVYLRAFRDDSILSALILLAAFLPPNAIPMLSRSMLSRLKRGVREEEEEGGGDYGSMLQAMCKWGKVTDVLELTNEWLEAALVTDADPNKSRRRSRRVGFVEPCAPRPGLALHYLSYLAGHAECRALLLRTGRHGLHDISATLQRSMVCIEQRLQSPEPVGEHCSDDFLIHAFAAYLKIQVLLSHKTEDGSNDDSTAVYTSMQRVLVWADRELLSLLRSKAPSQKRQRGKKLMAAADATLLANPSGSDSDLQSSIANHTIASHTLLASTSLLSDTLLDVTLPGSKRSAGGSAMEVGVQVIQTVLDVASNMLLVGVGDDDVTSQLADFAIMVLELDRGCELVSNVVTLLYQLVEWSVAHQEDNTLLAPSVLTRLIKWLAALTASRRDMAIRVLASVRGAVSEMLGSYFHHYSVQQQRQPGGSSSSEVVSALVHAVTDELTETIKQDAHFEACTTVGTLPALTAFLLGILVKKAVYTNVFVSELAGWLAEAAGTVNSRLATLHLLHALSADDTAAATATRLPTKDCLLLIQSHMEANPPPPEVSEDSPLTVKISSSRELLKRCMTATGMLT